MKSRKVLMLAVAILLAGVMGVVGCGKEDSGEIKLGADLTLSGQTAYWGQQVKKGLDIAVMDGNKEEGQRPIKVLYQDNQGEAKNAISIFKRFTDLDNVSCVISIFTPIAKPLRPLAEQQQVPLLATVVSAVGFGLENEWSFRDFPSQSQQATALASYVYNDMGVRTAVSFVVNDDYGRDGEKVFVEEFQKLGGQVLGTDTVDQSARDMRAQATKLIALDPECLFVVVRDITLGQAVKQFRELGFEGKICGVNAFDSPAVWEAVGDGGEGVVFTSAYVDFAGNDEAKRFATQYKAANDGQAPDWVSVYGYTIGSYLVDILREADGDPALVKEKLANMKANTIRGELHMNEDRDVISPVGIFVREGGENKVLKKI
jgi:branched-chain amino acid transport system substrate-binding protein